MKKILAYISPENYSSLFDIIVAYDAGVDVVVPYCNIKVADMRDMIHSCVFTRHPDKLNNTAIFIGGHDIRLGEEMMKKAIETLNELPEFFRVSITVDSDGAYTTSCACVAKIKNSLGDLDGLNVTILAGTGPVGQRVAVLLSWENCNVTLTSRKMSRSEAVCGIIEKGYGVKITPMEVNSPETTEKAISESDIVVTTGPEGVQILPKEIWSKFQKIKIMADLNAVPPYGIEGVEANFDGKEIAGKKVFGALAIGGLKMKSHHKLVGELFTKKNRVFDLKQIYNLTLGLL